MEQEFIADLKRVEESVRTATEGYQHSSPVVEYKITDAKGNEHPVAFDLREFLLTAAIAGENVLISGKTGGGKTSLATGVMNGLFDGNYGFLQIDPSFNEGKFRDMDFSKIKDGGKLSEASNETKAITAPGVVLDELNRAPPALTDILQGWLTNGIMILDGGRQVRPGVLLSDGSNYQFKIATINEGALYVGTHAIDKAARDRFAIEIPLDAFPPTEDDRRQLIINGQYRPQIGTNTQDLSEAVFRLHAFTGAVPVDPVVVEFAVKLLNKDNCYVSPEGTKLTFDRFTADICQQCPASAVFIGVCGEIFAPSERTMTNTMQLARAFAIYRVYQDSSTELQVTSQDFLTAAKFTLYKKFEIAPGWVEKHAGGSSWEATSVALNQLYSRFFASFQQTKGVFEKQFAGKDLNDDDRELLQKTLRTDPSFGTRAQMVQIYRNKAAVLNH